MLSEIFIRKEGLTSEINSKAIKPYKEQFSLTAFFLFLFVWFFFWPHPAACGILLSRPGIEPVPPALEAWSLNHRTAREVP